MKKLLLLLLLSVNAFADLHTVPGRIKLDITLQPGETAKFRERLMPVLSSNMPGAPAPSVWTEAWICLLTHQFASEGGSAVEISPGLTITQGGTPIDYSKYNVTFQGFLVNSGTDSIGASHYYFNELVSIPGNDCSQVVKFSNPIHMFHTLTGGIIVKNIGTVPAVIRARMWFLGK